MRVLMAWRNTQWWVGVVAWMVGFSLVSSQGVTGQSNGGSAYGPRLVHTQSFETRAWEGLDKMYAMNWAGADSVFTELDRMYPDHPAPPFVRAANLWWQVQMDLSHKGHDAEMLRLLELTIERCERILDTRKEDFEADFLLFGALGYKARLLAVRGSYWRAANVALSSMPPLKRGMRNKTQLTEFLFGSGLYNYFVVWYGEYRPIVKPFLGLFPRGDKAMGLRELEASAQVRNYTQIESATFLCEIFLDYERQYDKAERFSKWLAERYPVNTLFRYYHARAHYHANDYAEAKQLLDPLLLGYPARDPAQPIGVQGTRVTTQLFAWAALLRGEICLAEAQPAEALSWLDRAHRSTLTLGWHESEWRARILLQRGLAQDRLGRRADAQWSYQACLDVDNCPKLVKQKAEACLKAACQ